MPIKDAPFYWLECDGCGKRAEYYDEIRAWERTDQAIDLAFDWTQKDGKFHCPDCPPLDVDDD